jgi:hypothetical protein
MRAYKILFLFLLLSFSAKAQVFTFECLCGQYAGDTCDICAVNSTVESRSFSGLLIKKNGTPFKLIDAPYTIRVLKSGAIQFAELITNPEQITIARFQTQFATMAGFADSTNCLCNGGAAVIDTLFWINGGDSAVILGDTITVIQDTVTISNGGGLSVTGTYPDYTITQNISTDATLAGIGTPGNPLKIAQQSATTGQVLKWNGTTWLPNTDLGVTGSGVDGRVTFWTGTNTISSNGNFLWDNTNSRLGINVSPSYPFHVVGTAHINGDFNIVYPTNPRMFISGTGSDGWTLQYRTSDAGKLYYYDVTNGVARIVMTQTGRMGIGTTDPLNTLHIAGDMRVETRTGAATNIAGWTTDGVATNVPTGTGIGFSGGTISNTGDLSTTNELQNLSLAGQSLGISSGTGVTLPIVGVSAGTGMTVTTSSGVATVTNSGDLSNINELQTISSGTNTVTLSNSGGTVTVDTDPTNDLTTTTNFAGDVSGLYNNLQLGTGVVGPTELASTAVTAGTYGSGFTVPVFTVDADGRITGVTNTAISAGGSNWTISGSDIYRNSNVAIGTTSFAGAKLNVENLGSSNIGLRLGGGSVPSFGKIMEFSGNGTGAYSAINSTLTSLGNVIWRLSNEATTSGANSLVQVATGGTTSGGDPMVQFNCNGGNYSVMGIDNSVSGDPFKLQPYSAVGGGTYGLTMTNTGKFGITDETPEVTLDMAQNTDAISLPSGTTAQRPSVSLPLIRYNSTIGGPEYRDMNGSWGRIGCTSFPTFVFGNGAGTGSFPLATSVNDMGGSIAVNTGSSPTANGIFVTVTFGQGFSKNPAVTICDGNNAASNAKFIVDSISTVGFVIKVNGTLTAATDYIIRYTVTN